MDQRAGLAHSRVAIPARALLRRLATALTAAATAALLNAAAHAAVPGAQGERLPVAVATAPLLEAGDALGARHVMDPAPGLFTGTDAANSALGGAAPPAGTLAELSSVRVQGAYPVRVSRKGAVPGGEAGVLPLALLPGPSGTLALVCVLVVLVFIARRKIGLARRTLR